MCVSVQVNRFEEPGAVIRTPGSVRGGRVTGRSTLIPFPEHTGGGTGSLPAKGRPSPRRITPMRTASVVLLLLCCMTATHAAASTDDEPGTWQLAIGALNSTTPFPPASEEEQKRGWFEATWAGTKRIWTEGRTDVYLSGYFWHTPWGFTDGDRERYDDLGLGAGLGRTLTDEKGNQRLLYAIITQDSFNKPMYLAGYGWLARWRLPGVLRVGAGYSITILSNSSATDYIPVPLPVPLANLGTERASAFVTYINGIFYFFGAVHF